MLNSLANSSSFPFFNFSCFLYLHPHFRFLQYSTLGSDVQFTCQHGANECYGNKVHSCALEHIQVSWLLRANRFNIHSMPECVAFKIDISMYLTYMAGWYCNKFITCNAPRWIRIKIRKRANHCRSTTLHASWKMLHPHQHHSHLGQNVRTICNLRIGMWLNNAPTPRKAVNYCNIMAKWHMHCGQSSPMCHGSIWIT